MKIRNKNNHSYDSSHTCTVCDKKYNNESNVSVNGKSVAWNTHIFNGTTSCKVCGAKLEIVSSGFSTKLATWSSYEPNDKGNRTFTAGTLTETINGVFEASPTIVSTYAHYAPQNARWHANVIAETGNSDYPYHLVTKGKVGSTSQVTVSVAGDTITYRGYPTAGGPYRVLRTIDDLALSYGYRYTTPGATVAPSEYEYSLTTHYYYDGTKNEIKVAEEEGITNTSSYTKVKNDKDLLDSGYKYVRSYPVSDDGSVTFSDVKENKVVEFYYKKPEMIVEEIAVFSDAVSAECFDDYILMTKTGYNHLNDSNIGYNKDKKITVTDRSKDGYKIIGYHVEPGKSILDKETFSEITKKSNYTQLTVKPTEDQTLVTIFYKVEPLKTGYGIEFVHKTINGEEIKQIFPQDEVKRKFDDFAEFSEELKGKVGEFYEFPLEMLDSPDLIENFEMFKSLSEEGIRLGEELLAFLNVDENMAYLKLAYEEENELNEALGLDTMTEAEFKEMIEEVKEEVKSGIEYNNQFCVALNTLRGEWGWTKSNGVTPQSSSIRSLNLANPNYQFTNYCVTIGDGTEKPNSDNIIDMTSENTFINQKEQYIPNLNELMAKIEADSGLTGKKNLVITFWYTTKNRITVKYVDIDTGEELQAPDIVEVDFGNPATIGKKDFAGYKYISSNPNSADGNVYFDTVTENKEVIFYYRKQFTITEEHRDRDTGELITGVPDNPKRTVIDRGGTISEPTPKEIPGYQFKEVEGLPIGTVTEDKTVIFWYEKKPVITGDIDPDGDDVQTSSNLNGDNKCIVLDDLFTIKMEIENFDKIADGSSLYIQFPFDVYYKNGDLYTAGSVIKLDNYTKGGDGSTNSTYGSNPFFTFRLPVYVVEKVYDNGTKIYIKLGNDVITEKEISITVIGRLYDFTVTNLEADTMWQQTMFKNGQEYKAATLPIGQKDTQPKAYNYGIKLGSTFLFSINTKGLKSDSIQVTPKIIYLDKDGNQQNVNLYYKVTGKGEVPFNSNTGMTFQTTLNKNLRMTKAVANEVSKAMQLASLTTPINRPIGIKDILKANKGTENIYKGFSATVGRNYGNLTSLLLPNTLRVPYAAYLSEEVQKIGKTGNEWIASVGEPRYEKGYIGLTEDEIIYSTGHWYAEYKLPSTLVAKDMTGKELNDGYFVVLFKIVSRDYNGNEYLSYALPSNNTQWMKEKNDSNYTNQHQVAIHLPGTITNTNGVSKNLDLKNLKDYYPVAIYQAGVSINSDWEVAGTH